MSKVALITSNPEKSKHLETATLRIDNFWVDFVNLRTESYVQDSRIPSINIGTPMEDAFRRCAGGGLGCVCACIGDLFYFEKLIRKSKNGHSPNRDESRTYVVGKFYFVSFVERMDENGGVKKLKKKGHALACTDSLPRCRVASSEIRRGILCRQLFFTCSEIRVI